MTFIPQLRLLLCFAFAFYIALVWAAEDALAMEEPAQAEELVGGLRRWLRGSNAQEVPQVVLAEEPRLERSPGDDAYRQAVIILEEIQTAQPVSRLLKPSGFVEAAVWSVKEMFKLLFMNAPRATQEEDAQEIIAKYRDNPRLSEPLAAAVKLLKQAAADGHPDALWTLAEMNFRDTYHPHNYRRAFMYYQTLAELTGNASAQHMLGFFYATGLGKVVEKDQAKALLYHTFAANAGDTQSQMTVAFRHHSGIGTVRNCNKAQEYYKLVADKAIKWVRSGPPGGRHLPKENYRLADEVGGVYGQGASVSSSGHNAHPAGTNKDHNANLGNLVEYFDLTARRGDISAMMQLARMYYEGSRVIEPDYRLAAEYFLQVARRYWKRDGKIHGNTDYGLDKRASQAAAYLGRMFLRGEGREQDFTKARTWFKRGIANGEPLCQYSMGLMYLHGLGVEKDPVKAASYFLPAADQELAPAQVQMGALLLDQGDIASATKYFELAARHGHIEAFYYLAEMSSLGAGRDKSCSMATVYYKIVSEKAEELHSSFRLANEAYEKGDMDTALPYYMQAAEQGYEAAQANVAYILDLSIELEHELSGGIFRTLTAPLFHPFFSRAKTYVADAALALIYWTRSAKQSNYDSLVKMGDYYLIGLGTPLSQPDAEKAAACYQAAAEQLTSAQAMWNLGWMHENGIGIAQDFHLAKRFYDQALETNPVEAYLPVTLALLKLRVRSWWNTLVRGKVNSIRDEPASSKKRPTSFAQWIGDFLQADLDYWDNVDGNGNGRGGGQGLHEHGGDPNLPPPSSAEAGDEWNMPPEEYLDEMDEGVVETLLILVLATALIGLVWWRQQRGLEEQRRRQRAEGGAGAGAGAAVQGQVQGQGQGQGAVPDQAAHQDRGVFPAPGDVDFNNWAVGGVGH